MLQAARNLRKTGHSPPERAPAQVYGVSLVAWRRTLTQRRTRSRCHEAKYYVAAGKVVDHTDNDEADERDGKPADNDETTDAGVSVAEMHRRCL